LQGTSWTKSDHIWCQWSLGWVYLALCTLLPIRPDARCAWTSILECMALSGHCLCQWIFSSPQWLRSVYEIWCSLRVRTISVPFDTQWITTMNNVFGNTGRELRSLLPAHSCNSVGTFFFPCLPSIHAFRNSLAHFMKDISTCWCVIHAVLSTLSNSSQFWIVPKQSTTSAKCTTVWKLQLNNSATLNSHTDPSRCFQMLPERVKAKWCALSSSETTSPVLLNALGVVDQNTWISWKVYSCLENGTKSNY